MNQATSKPSPSQTPATPAAGALPPGLLLYQLAIGHYGSRALALAAKLEIADALSGGARSPEELAAATESSADPLRRVLRLLASLGVLLEDDQGRFALTDLGQLLRSDVPGSMRDAVLVFAGEAIQDGWKELEYCVRTGKPAFEKQGPGGDAFDPMRADPVFEAIFDRAMAAFTSQAAIAVASAYDFGAFDCVLDVGGGNGALLIGILRRFERLRGIVFDRPSVVERAREQAESAGVAERLEVAGGSFFESIPSGADAYLLKHVIHDWADAEAIEILRRCRTAIGANGKLLVVEGLYPERIDSSLPSRGAAANDVNMLVSTGGRQRSEAEFRALYARAGFELVRVVPTAGAVSLIEGAPR